MSIFELACRTVFGSHHVHRRVDVLHDRRIALPDARRFDDHQIEAGNLHAAITSGSACEISLPASRVASERM